METHGNQSEIRNGTGSVARITPGPAVSEDPRLISAIAAVAAVAAMTVELQRLETELRETRRRLITAADLERQRVERNLHDGAQQRLVAVKVRLRLAIDLIEPDSPDGARMLEILVGELDRAIDDLRELAQGLYPKILLHSGLPSALRAAARHGTLPTTVNADGIGRYDPEIEAAIYFCCLGGAPGSSLTTLPQSRSPPIPYTAKPLAATVRPCQWRCSARPRERSTGRSCGLATRASP